MIGLDSHLQFNERWYGDLLLGYGGWGVDDAETVWDAILNVGYQFKMRSVDSRAYFGYRYLYIDYVHGKTEIEVDVRGPYIGIGWQF